MIQVRVGWVVEKGKQSGLINVCIQKHSVLALLQSYCFSTCNSRFKHSEMMSQASRILLAGNDWLRKCIQVQEDPVGRH